MIATEITALCPMQCSVGGQVGGLQTTSPQLFNLLSVCSVSLELSEGCFAVEWCLLL